MKAESPPSELPVDESLTSEEYIGLGLPSDDRIWMANDMVEAVKVMTALEHKGGGKLPRYRGERSGKMFARLTSPQNFEIYKNRSLTLDVRFPQALVLVKANGQLLKLYLAAFLKKGVRASELVELMGLQLRSCVAMLELGDEFIPTIKKDDPHYAIRMQGLEQMRQGYAGVVAGAFQTLTERETYRSDELQRLVAYMIETVPRIAPQLLPGSRLEIATRLDKMNGDPAMKDLQPGLEELRGKVKTTHKE